MIDINIEQKMFHILDAYQLKLTKRQPNKIIMILALNPPNIATITNHRQLHIYNIEKPQLIFSHKLNSLPRKILHHQLTNSVILHCQQDQILLALDLLRMEVSQIYQFKNSCHYHTEHMMMRQKEYLSSMSFIAFNCSKRIIACYQKMDQRKQGMFLFEKVEGQWLSKDKVINNSGSIMDKMDEFSKVAIWKQCIINNGAFSFTSLNLIDDSQQFISLHYAAFTSFSVIKKVKLDKKDNILIFVNHKHPEIVYFSKNQKTTSQNLLTNTIWTVIFTDYSINLSVSLAEGSGGRLQLRQKQQSNLLQSLEGKFSQVSIGHDGHWLIDYEIQKEQSNEIRLRVIKIHQKKILMADLIEKWRLKVGWKIGLSNDIFDLLV